MQNTAPTINTDGISDQEKSTTKFQSVCQGMLAQLRKPGFIPVLCAHEAAHLVYFARIGMTQYVPHPASIRYDPRIKDYVGDLAGVQPLDLTPWQEGGFWEWFGIVACAHAAGGAAARRLMPSTAGGDEDDRERFKAICDQLNKSDPQVSIKFEEAWKQAQAAVEQDLDNPEIARAIEEQASVLKREFGL